MDTGRELEKFGYKVITAHDGLEALEFYSTHTDKIDLVLLDMTMPKMDGARLLKELLNVNPQLKAVMFSGYGYSAVISELLKGRSRKFLTNRIDRKNWCALFEKCSTVGRMEMEK